MQTVVVMYSDVDTDFAHDVLGVVGIAAGGPEPKAVIEAISEEYGESALTMEDFLAERFGGDTVTFMGLAGVAFV